MEEEVKKKRLPDFIILEDEHRKIRVSWMAVLAAAQKAYDYLLADRDVGECLPEFDSLTSKWITKHIEEKVAAVMKSPQTYSARMEAVGEWREVERDLLEKMQKINTLRKLDPKAKIETRGCHLCISNMNELLAEKSKFVVPKWYHDYYALVCDVNDAIMRLREFEETAGHKMQIRLDSVAFDAENPEDFIKVLISNQKMYDYLHGPTDSHFKQEGLTWEEQQELNKQIQREKEEAHAEYLRKQEEGRKELIKKGQEVDFKIKKKHVDGSCIPVLAK